MEANTGTPSSKDEGAIFLCRITALGQRSRVHAIFPAYDFFRSCSVDQDGA